MPGSHMSGRLLRVALGVALSLSLASLDRLGLPPAAAALDPCDFVLPPFASDDPTNPGDPNYQTLEDTHLGIVAEFGFLANDCGTDGVSSTEQSFPGLALHISGTMGYTPPPNATGNRTGQYRFTSS